MTIDEVNVLCAEIAAEDAEIRIGEIVDAFLEEQEELANLELQKQYEFLSLADLFADQDAIYYGEV